MQAQIGPETQKQQRRRETHQAEVNKYKKNSILTSVDICFILIQEASRKEGRQAGRQAVHEQSAPSAPAVACRLSYTYNNLDRNQLWSFSLLLLFVSLFFPCSLTLFLAYVFYSWWRHVVDGSTQYVARTIFPLFRPLFGASLFSTVDRAVLRKEGPSFQVCLIRSSFTADDYNTSTSTVSDWNRVT